MKHMVVAGLLCLFFVERATAQVIVGGRFGDGIVYSGAGPRFGFQRGSLFVGGTFPFVATSYYSVTTVYPPIYLVPPPLIVRPAPVVINNFFAVPGPVLGPGYDTDIRGVDLDKIPLKKTKPNEVALPSPKQPEPEPAKPWPGKEISKPRDPVRPGDAKPEPKPPAKVPPPEPFADPLDESSRLSNLGLAAFHAGEYGLAAQHFRQAAAVAPLQIRAWFLLSQAEFASGNYREAVAAIHAGMKVDKLWPRLAFHPRLELYKGRDADYAEHLKRLTDAVASQPNHPALLFLLAHELWFDRQRKDALALFQRAKPLASNPVFIETFLAAGGPGIGAAP